MFSELILFIGALIVSFISIKIIASINKKKKITGIDINKKEKPEIPESTGIALLIPLWIFVALQFFEQPNQNFIYFALAVTALCFTGFIDDLKPKFREKTISWKLRAIVAGLIAAFFGWFFYPNYLALQIAIFFIVLASLQNTFAGLNGWEIGSGFIISVFVAFLLKTSIYFPATIVLSGSILGLLLLNKFPAKVFPGDSGTLFIGASIAGIVVLTGRDELILIVLLFFLPHLIDIFLLKLLTNKKDMSQQQNHPYKLLENGKLDFPNGARKYDFAKLLIKIFGPLKEWQIVIGIWSIVLLNCLFWVWFFGFI